MIIIHAYGIYHRDGPYRPAVPPRFAALRQGALSSPLTGATQWVPAPDSGFKTGLPILTFTGAARFEIKPRGVFGVSWLALFQPEHKNSC